MSLGEPFCVYGLLANPLAFEVVCAFFGTPFVFFEYMCIMGIPIGWVEVFCLVCMMRAGGVDSFKCWNGRFGFRLGGRMLQLVQVQF